jgi:hypothetical protein
MIMEAEKLIELKQLELGSGKDNEMDTGETDNDTKTNIETKYSEMCEHLKKRSENETKGNENR